MSPSKVLSQSISNNHNYTEPVKPHLQESRKATASNHAKEGVTKQTFGDRDKRYCNLHENEMGETGQKTSGRRALAGENEPLNFQNEIDLGLGQVTGVVLNPTSRKNLGPSIAACEINSQSWAKVVDNVTMDNTTKLKLGSGEAHSELEPKEISATQLSPSNPHPQLEEGYLSQVSLISLLQLDKSDVVWRRQNK